MAIVANRYWLLLLLLTGAAVSYAGAFMVGFWALLVAGVLLELAAWREFFKRTRR